MKRQIRQIGTKTQKAIDKSATLWYNIQAIRRHSQAVRHGSAKPLFLGPIPSGASIKRYTPVHRGYTFLLRHPPESTGLRRAKRRRIFTCGEIPSRSIKLSEGKFEILENIKSPSAFTLYRQHFNAHSFQPKYSLSLIVTPLKYFLYFSYSDLVNKRGSLSEKLSRLYSWTCNTGL